MPTIGDTYIIRLYEIDEEKGEPVKYCNYAGKECKIGFNFERPPYEFNLSKIEHIAEYLISATHLGYVTIPRDVSVTKEPNCNIWVAKEIYITNIVKVQDLECWRNPEFCLNAVQKNGNILQYVPDHLKTEELCLDAVRQNGWALCYVPSEQRNVVLCLIAVRYNGWLLSYVPDNLKTRDLCLQAVRQNKNALAFVPDAFKEACLAVV